MKPNGVGLEMDSAGDETSKQSEEVPTSPFDGVYSRAEHQQSLLEVPESDDLSGAKVSAEDSDVSTGGSSRKDNGLRSKRGEGALKIHVSFAQEEAERRKSHYAATVAEGAPLYPLDLRDHPMESSNDGESDRSSSFSPEVAANGFGSPIDLPSREGFDDLSREQNDHIVDNVHKGTKSSLDDVPLTGRFPPATVDEHDSDFDDDLVQASDNRVGGRSFLKYLLQTISLILLWYTFSTLLVLYNKILLGHDKNDMQFPAPLLMNTMHFSMQAILANVILRCVPSTRPTRPMLWRDYFIRVVPTAVATAFDIDLTNAAFVFVSVTFVTMGKSGGPVFLLMFAFLFKLEVPSWRLLGIIVVISTGVLLTFARATDFNLVGFILVMSAAIMSGFRWSVTQLLLQKEEYGLNNPFATMGVLTPIMAAISFFLSAILESWGELGNSKYFDSLKHLISSSALMVLGGSLAFCMVSTEFFLLSKTSAVTMTIASIVKEMVTILVAVIFLKDKFTPLKGVGLTIIIFGVSLYNVYKYNQMKAREGGFHPSSNLNGSHRYVPLNETRSVFELGDEIDEEENL